MKQQERFWENAAAEASFTEEEVVSAGGGEYILNESNVDNIEDMVLDSNNLVDSVQASLHKINFALELNSTFNFCCFVKVLQAEANEAENNWEMNRIKELEAALLKKDIECGKEKAKNKSLRRKSFTYLFP